MRHINRIAHKRRVLAMAAVMAGLSVVTNQYAQTPSQGAESAVKLTITCVPDRPIAYPGETIVVRAWVSATSDIATENITWKSSVGTINGDIVATWSFPKDKKNASSEAPAMAEAMVTHQTLGRVECQIPVYFVNPLVLRGPGRPPLLSGRSFLVAGRNEPDGYGLYSYILFSAPPRNDIERERFLKALESYLQVVQPIEELELYRDRTLLNITLIPVKVPIDFGGGITDPGQARELAIKLLNIYDYARAQVLLSGFGIRASGSGPFLIARKISKADSDSVQPLLNMDMSQVSANLVWDWTKAFCILATQEPSWTEATLRRLALNVRNVIAVAAKNTPPVLGELDKWIQVFKSH
jgi:hypothetical protein